MREYEVVKVDEDSPDRCQSNDANGQCRNKVVEGSQYCPVHGGNRAYDSKIKKDARNYRLDQWTFQQQLEQKTDSEGIKSLRDEIAILRLLMEERLKMCTAPSDLLIHSGAISDLATRIEKLVSSCNRLENSLGQLLDKNAVIRIVSEIIAVIQETLSDQPDTVQTIANQIFEIVTKTREND